MSSLLKHIVFLSELHQLRLSRQFQFYEIYYFKMFFKINKEAMRIYDRLGEGIRRGFRGKNGSFFSQKMI